METMWRSLISRLLDITTNQFYIEGKMGMLYGILGFLLGTVYGSFGVWYMRLRKRG